MNRQLESVLSQVGIQDRKMVLEAQTTAGEGKHSLLEVLSTLSGVGEAQLAESFAREMRIPYLRLATMPLETETARAIPEELAQKYLCIPVKKIAEAEGSGGGRKRRPILQLAMSDPSDLMALQEVEFATDCQIKPAVATTSEIRDAIAQTYAPEKWLKDFMQHVDESDELRVMDILAEERGPVEQEITSPAVKLVNLLLKHGVKETASDIHIEPAQNNVHIRMRVQGLLREFMNVPKWLHEPLASRIKILARMDITEKRLPQDGRIKAMLEESEVDFRVSTLPTQFGEKLVLRILCSGQTVPGTANIGLSARDLEALKRATDQPQGLVLVTGPTGSGKTTTLYSVVKEKKNPSINIVAVEDPIEIQMPGVNQVPVNTKTGMTFAAALRSILRQDPDVILLGEVRDLETAEIAFHAASTGHLVLSTLHTNSTTATISRLLDLGVDPFLICANVNLIMAQRLARTVCQNCKESYRPSAANLRKFRLPAELGFVRGKGCGQCGHTGYKGRVGIYEVLRLTPALKELIARRAPEAELRKAAAANGTTFLLEDALAKARQGVTTLEEVARVVQSDDEPELPRCSGCSKEVEEGFTVCPFCAQPLKASCQGCRRELMPQWKSCPYCSKPVAATGGDDAAASVGEAKESRPMDEPEAKEEDGACILVVDDDEVMRSLLVTALEQMPLRPRVIEASSGEEALALAQRHRPHAILLDLKMPGMNGFEVCERLRKNLQTTFIPIVMLTASTDEQSRSRGFMVGTDDFMAKPVSVPELHSRVNRLLRRTYGM